MINASASQFHIYLEEAFSVIVKTGSGTDGALHSTNKYSVPVPVLARKHAHKLGLSLWWLCWMLDGAMIDIASLSRMWEISR